MLDFLKTCLTTNDNQSGDIVRICFFLSVIVYLTLELINWRTFNAASFGAGIGMVFATGAGSLLLKQKTEPDIK